MKVRSLVLLAAVFIVGNAVIGTAIAAVLR